MPYVDMLCFFDHLFKIVRQNVRHVFAIVFTPFDDVAHHIQHLINVATAIGVSDGRIGQRQFKRQQHIQIQIGAQLVLLNGSVNGAEHGLQFRMKVAAIAVQHLDARRGFAHVHVHTVVRSIVPFAREHK